MADEQRVEQLTYPELIQRIENPEVWGEFLSRYMAKLEQFRDWYNRNRIRGGAVSFDDILQELLVPTEKRPIGYLQKALIDERPSTEDHCLRLAKKKFKQRLIDEARREARKQLIFAAEMVGDIPGEQPPGLASLEIWKIVRDAVGDLDESERIAIRLYYGLPETDDGDDREDAVVVSKISEMISEMGRKGIDLTYEQAKEKLKKARRILRVVLLPYSESLNEE